MSNDYHLCGWHLRSSLPFPALLPWNGPADHPVDITVQPAPITVEADETLCYRHDRANGDVFAQIPGLFRLLIRQGSTVLVDQGETTVADAPWLPIISTALPILCEQRNLLSLHAACIRIKGKGVALVGTSGTGKSTLSAGLWRRRFQLLGDDCAVIDSSVKTEIRLRPTMPRLRLWPDSIKALCELPVTAPPAAPGIQKYDLDIKSQFSPDPVPLNAIMVLQKATHQGVKRLPPSEAEPLLRAHLTVPDHAKYGELDSQAPPPLRALTTIAAQVPVYAFDMPASFLEIPKSIALLEETLKQ